MSKWENFKNLQVYFIWSMKSQKWEDFKFTRLYYFIFSLRCKSVHLCTCATWVEMGLACGLIWSNLVLSGLIGLRFKWDWINRWSVRFSVQPVEQPCSVRFLQHWNNGHKIDCFFSENKCIFFTKKIKS